MEQETKKLTKRRAFSFSRRVLAFTLAAAGFFAVFLLLPAEVEWEARTAIAVLLFGLLLWALEPIPLGMTSILTLVLLLLMKAVSIDVALSGFASPAVFLIVAGMMIAKAVNETPLMDRLTYSLLAKWGRSPKGIFIGLFLLMQVQAFFIPATAVRTQLVIPVVLSVITAVGAKKGSNFSKLMLIGTAFAGNISGTAILTAAIGNILTIEILQLYLGRTLSYFDWFLYAFPIWLLLMAAIPFIVWKTYPPEDYSFAALQEEMKKKKSAIGPLTGKEIKCIVILTGTVLLWMTQSLHGFHPTVPALLAVVLFAMPKIGFVSWKKVINVNFDMVILIGATLSLGMVLIETGAIDLLASMLKTDAVLKAFGNPWLAILVVVIVSHLYHLGVTNVSTAVVTLLPVLIGLANLSEMDPMVIVFASSVSTLFGFMLIVETMPNVIVHGTGLVAQRDFYIPGFWATVASIVIVAAVAFTWWRWLGFWPM